MSRKKLRLRPEGERILSRDAAHLSVTVSLDLLERLSTMVLSEARGLSLFLLYPHEEATVRCAKARHGSNSSSASQAPVRSKTSGPHPRHSILPPDSVFIDRCGTLRHVQLIPSTGWSEPVPGRELHPLKSSAFHVALFRRIRVKTPNPELPIPGTGRRKWRRELVRTLLAHGKES
jgi:hypothetical protein